MLLGTSEKPFNIKASGIGEINSIALPESGMLFACVIGGECEITVRDRTVRYSVGTTFVKGLDAKTKVAAIGKIAYCVAEGSFCEQICGFSGVTDGFSVSVSGASEEMFRICALAEAEETELSELVFRFHTLVKALADAKKSEEKRKVDLAVLIKEYIDSHALGKLSLEDISKVFFISKTQIFRIYKSCFGISPMQYFLQKKIDASKKMLTEDNMRVADIAETLGFSDPKHYSKTFKRFVGMLPREYRKEKRAAGLSKLMSGSEE